MPLLLFVICYSASCLLISVWTLTSPSGPAFIHEPPSVVEFTNNTGAVIQCTASGEPTPVVTWTWSDGRPVSDTSQYGNEMMVRGDGSFIFSPFMVQRYRKEIHHDGVFRCVAKNKYGTVGSRDVHINGVLAQPMDLRVYDEFVMKGNIAVLKCLTPNVLFNFITNIVWHSSDGLTIRAHETQGKYTAYPSGELHVRSVDQSDSLKTFRCEARNRLTGQSFVSQSGGQLIVTEQRTTMAPRIVHRKSEIIAHENDHNVLIPCASHANPLPNYKWHKQGKLGAITPLQLSQRLLILDGSLVISRVALSDSGRYIATVTNSAGQERCETNLIVRSPLKVIIYPNGLLQMTPGQSLNITCRVMGSPIDGIKWTHDLNQISLVSNPTLRNTDLFIASLQRKDVGMFQCFAYNGFESTQASVQIAMIDEPPRLIHTFEEKVLYPGNSLSLSCAAIGSPLAQLQWSVDGGLSLPESSRFRSGDFVTVDNKVVSYVNVTNVRTEDGGLYRCSAKNDVGTAYHEARVNVYGPPSIKPMPNVTALAGETIHLFCRFHGYPIHSIVWHNRDGRIIPIHGRQQLFANGTFAIRNINRKSDEGSYQCHVQQQNLKAHSSVYVKVLVGPRIDPFSFPEDLEEGMRSVVVCAVRAGDAPILIKWNKDGHELPGDLQVEMVNQFTSTITFNSVRPEHAGEYTCTATNQAALANHTATLLVQVPPYWVKEPQSKEVVIGHTTIIDCQAMGIPMPQIRWKRMEKSDQNEGIVANVERHDNFRTIISNPHIQILENGSLIIRDITKSDARKYICTAFNSVNPSLSTIVTVDVHSPPQFEEKFHALSIKKGDPLKLECAPLGEEGEPIDIEWRKDSMPISANSNNGRYQETSTVIPEKGSVQSQLIIESAARIDSALFTCIAVNKYGSDEKSYRIIVQEIPEKPTEIRAQMVTSNSATITWSQPYNGNTPLLEYLIECKLAKEPSWTKSLEVLRKPATDTTYIVRSLLPSSTYHIRVCAINILGHGEYSDILTINTLEEAPSLPPGNIRISATGARSLKVSWKKPKSESGLISIRGYYIGYRAHSTDNAYVFKTIDAAADNDFEEYQINNLMKFTKYDIRVQAFNSAGAGPASDDITGLTLEFDAPTAPVIRVLTTTSSTIELEWNVYGDEPITSYVIFYKGEDKEWKERRIAASKSYVIDGLRCGTRYQIYMSAINSVGQGDPSDVILARTEGTVPFAPEKNSLIISNSTFVILILNAWHSGCPINHFVIKHKQQRENDWFLVADNVPLESDKLIISNLMPGVWYNLLIIAHSDAGSTNAEYVFSTLTPAGGTIPPFTSQTSYELTDSGFTIGGTSKWLIQQLNFIIPISCAVTIVIIVAIVICILQLRNSADNDMSRVTLDGNSFKDDNPIAQMDDAIQKHCTSDNRCSVEMTHNTPLSQQSESIYFPSPYAMSRVGYNVAQLDDVNECSFNTPVNPHPSGISKHTYEVPFLVKRNDHGEDQYSRIKKVSIPFQDISDTSNFRYNQPSRSDSDHKHGYGCSDIDLKDNDKSLFF